jgi:hypothetical protein
MTTRERAGGKQYPIRVKKWVGFRDFTRTEHLPVWRTGAISDGKHKENAKFSTCLKGSFSRRVFGYCLWILSGFLEQISADS